MYPTHEQFVREATDAVATAERMVSNLEAMSGVPPEALETVRRVLRSRQEVLDTLTGKRAPEPVAHHPV